MSKPQQVPCNSKCCSAQDGHAIWMTSPPDRVTVSNYEDRKCIMSSPTKSHHADDLHRRVEAPSFVASDHHNHGKRSSRFTLFGLHVKYLCVAKSLWLLWYCVLSVTRDVSMVRVCTYRDTETRSTYTWNNCPRPAWVWLYELVGRLPWFIVRLPEATLGFMLYIIMLSSVLFLFAVYLRSTSARRRPRGVFRALRTLMVIPSIVIEMLLIFLCYYNVFVSVEFRVVSAKQGGGSIRPFVDAAFLASMYLSMVIVHLLCVWYVCENERHESFLELVSPMQRLAAAYDDAQKCSEDILGWSMLQCPNAQANHPALKRLQAIYEAVQNSTEHRTCTDDTNRFVRPKSKSLLNGGDAELESTPLARPTRDSPAERSCIQSQKRVVDDGAVTPRVSFNTNNNTPSSRASCALLNTSRASDYQYIPNPPMYDEAYSTSGANISPPALLATPQPTPRTRSTHEH